MHTYARNTGASAFALQIRGRVSSSVCRTTRAGLPVVVIELQDIASGQTVCATHYYPDASFVSATAARCLAKRLQGQVADIEAVNPRFKAKRLECEARHVHTQQPTTARRDFE